MVNRTKWWAEEPGERVLSSDDVQAAARSLELSAVSWAYAGDRRYEQLLAMVRLKLSPSEMRRVPRRDLAAHLAGLAGSLIAAAEHMVVLDGEQTAEAVELIERAIVTKGSKVRVE